MSLWKYKYFLDVVELKSFTKAGARNYVTQTAVSQQIASLEKMAGVTVRGSVAPLIELGAGFDYDLTAEENVYLNGALLGYPRAEMEKHYNDIVEFSELHDFMNVPVKNFSSGMISRLAFSIATIGIPDILIVDEVLSVGDFRFQEKCKNRIKNMLDKGTTLLFVSHSIEQVEELCNKVVWLDKGNLKMAGESRNIAEIYSAS